MAPPSPDPLFVLRGSGAPVNTLHFSCRDAVSPLLFSGSAKGTIHIWNLTTHRTERTLDGHGGASVLWLSTLRSADTLISQGRDMRLCTWDLSEGRSVVADSLVTGNVGFCQGSLLDRETGHWLLALPGEELAEVRIIELPSKMPVCSLKPEAKLGMPMCLKLWQPDSGCGPQLLVGYEDGTIALWDLSQRKQLSHLAAYSQPVMCLDFDQGKLRGVSGSSETVIKSWSLDGQQRLQVRPGDPLECHFASCALPL